MVRIKEMMGSGIHRVLVSPAVHVFNAEQVLHEVLEQPYLYSPLCKKKCVRTNFCHKGFLSLVIGRDYVAVGIIHLSFILFRRPFFFFFKF